MLTRRYHSSGYPPPWRIVSSVALLLVTWILLGYSSNAIHDWCPSWRQLPRGGASTTSSSQQQQNETRPSTLHDDEDLDFWSDEGDVPSFLTLGTSQENIHMEDPSSSATESADETAASPSSNNAAAEKQAQLDRKRLLFLDRIAWMSSTWLKREQDAHFPHHDQEQWDAITPESDLTLPGRHFHIVTTAALPWFTGTAVNPLLRAAYLHRRTREIKQNHNHSYVTLIVPWLELPSDQEELFGAILFEESSQQEAYIRNWLRQEAAMPDVADDLTILFYPARYHAGLRSIFAMGDMLATTQATERDVCILEEPEHVNWFRAPGDGWTKQYRYVIGIVHTSECVCFSRCVT